MATPDTLMEAIAKGREEAQASDEVDVCIAARVRLHIAVAVVRDRAEAWAIVAQNATTLAEAGSILKDRLDEALQPQAPADG